MKAEHHAMLQQRDTPAGRHFEVRVGFWDALFLIVGCVGLTIAAAPLLYIAAAGHLVCSFAVAVSKRIWLVLEPALVALSTGAVTAGVYATARLSTDYAHAEALSQVIDNWPRLIASGVVMAGVIGSLFAHVGALDHIRELLNERDRRQAS